MPGVLLFRQWCMRHNAHLTSKKTLVRLMKGKYWNELAKIINSWRGHGNAAKTCRAYAARFGMERANAVAATPPPRPLRGRWGAAHATEKRIIRCSGAELPFVFDDALGKQGQVTLKSDGPDKEECLNELDPDAEGYQEQKGRWIRDASAALWSPDWWVCLFIAHIVRQPQVDLEVWLSDTDTTKPPKVAASILQSLNAQLMLLCRSETHSGHCL